jgi:hypothetical protein
MESKADDFILFFSRAARLLIGFQLVIVTLVAFIVLGMKERTTLFPPGNLSGFAYLVGDHINLLILGLWFATLLGYVATIGLRRRKRWAYKSWILLLGAGIVVAVCGLVTSGIQGDVSFLVPFLLILVPVVLLLRRFLADDLRTAFLVKVGDKVTDLDPE